MATLAAALVAVLPARAPACGVELILALDVSRSVMNHEYDLQLYGLADAFRDPDVVETIGWIPGGVAVTLSQWSGAAAQSQSISWRLLDRPATVRSFADEIAATRRKYFGAFTAIGEALRHAEALSSTNPHRCARRVIDVSGDGRSNRGQPPRAVADALSAKGFTINALVIRGAKPDPVAYYSREVIAGPGAFVQPAEDFHDYARAMRLKLLRELSPGMASR